MQVGGQLYPCWISALPGIKHQPSSMQSVTTLIELLKHQWSQNLIMLIKKGKQTKQQNVLTHTVKVDAKSLFKASTTLGCGWGVVLVFVSGWDVRRTYGIGLVTNYEALFLCCCDIWYQNINREVYVSNLLYGYITSMIGNDLYTYWRGHHL